MKERTASGQRRSMLDTSGVKTLVYHRVDHDAGDRLREWSLSPRAFEAQMTALCEGGYRVLPLEEVLQVVEGRRPSPPRAVALTFDDGYLTLLDHVLPILKRFGFRATFFLVSGRMGATNVWDDRHGDRPRALMDWNDAAVLARAGMEIGSHSRTHPFLTTLSPAEIEREIRGSKEDIEDRLGQPVRFFSYPHGLYDARSLRAVAAAGYAGACSSLFGGNGAGVDPFQLRRSEVSHYDTRWSFTFKARTGFSLRRYATAGAGELLRRLTPAARGAAS